MAKRRYPPATQPVAYTRMTAPKRRNTLKGKLSESTFTPEPPAQATPERDLMIFREYKRELRACDEGACECACLCHAGDACPLMDREETTRIHTRGHKSVSIVLKEECPITGIVTRRRVDVACHDSNPAIPKRYHERKPNTAHKKAHRE